jgi:hypothetical protein
VLQHHVMLNAHKMRPPSMARAVTRVADAGDLGLKVCPDVADDIPSPHSVVAV